MAVESVQVVIEGIATELTLNVDTGLWESSGVLAPASSSFNNNAGHYFPVTIKATDGAGNTATVDDTDLTLGEELKLRVLETTLPVIVISNPTEGELTNNTMPTVNWTVTDSGSGVNPDTIGVTINDGSKITGGITKTPITNGYQCSYSISVALPDGQNTIKVDASDYDGNAATTRAVNFVVDTVPPSLSVTSPINNLVTNNDTVAVSGSASDVTAGISKVSVKINGGSEQDLTIDASGNFTENVTLSEGANTIVVTVVDTIGLSTSVTRIVTLDTAAPVIESIQITPNPVNAGSILSVTAEVLD